MLFFLPLLLQAYDPEIEAVMNRSRREKQQEQAAAAAAASNPLAARGDGKIPVPEKFAAPFQACLDAALDSSEAGVAFAQKWRIDGGSFYARDCMGFAYTRAERWAPAIVAFEQAAEEAERQGEVAQSARLWAQAGNAALASGDAAKARQDFDAALARGMPDGLEKGEVLYLNLGHCRGHYDMQPLMDYYPNVERGSWDRPQYYELLRRGIRYCCGISA